jgi:hypothetical protein
MKNLSPFILLTGVYLLVGSVAWGQDAPIGTNGRSSYRQDESVDAVVESCEKRWKGNDARIEQCKLAAYKMTQTGGTCDGAIAELNKARITYDTACKTAGLGSGAGSSCKSAADFCTSQYDDINENSASGNMSANVSAIAGATLGAGMSQIGDLWSGGNSNLSKCLPTRDSAKDLKDELKDSKKDVDQLIKDMQSDQEKAASDAAAAQKELANLTKQADADATAAQKQSIQSDAEFKNQVVASKAAMTKANSAILAAQIDLARALSDRTAKLSEFDGTVAQDKCTTAVQDEYYTYIEKVNKGERSQKQGVDRNSKKYWLERYKKCIAAIESTKQKLAQDYGFAIQQAQNAIADRQAELKSLQEADNNMQNQYQQQLLIAQSEAGKKQRAISQDRYNIMQEAAQKQQIQQQKNSTSQMQLMTANKKYGEVSAEMTLYGGSKNLSRAKTDDYTAVFGPASAFQNSIVAAQTQCCKVTAGTMPYKKGICKPKPGAGGEFDYNGDTSAVAQ